ncbi:hypothetical protein [Achromobacter aloeverae]|uniref:Uncharacterized protein n=1 Tax=Achromobacter aloeverae TaxID=1750518 RepID=A0A4Q1HEJ5_9BURK|nr:hypothetical protein [Achromobacter aloeverae]RXN83810.1 hypothetical protein C7R54_26450 [Achromobacter aloeverae]
MTVAVQPQFSVPFSHDLSGTVAGTFGSIAGATPGTPSGGKRAGKLPTRLAGRLTGKWPFRPAPQDQAPTGRGADDQRVRPTPEAMPAERLAKPGDVSVRQMVTDILLVGMWGAMIPGLMWLGSALGF